MNIPFSIFAVLAILGVISTFLMNKSIDNAKAESTETTVLPFEQQELSLLEQAKQEQENNVHEENITE